MSAILETLRRIERESPQPGFQSSQQRVDSKKALKQPIRRLWLLRRLATTFIVLLVLGGGAWALVSYRPWGSKGSTTKTDYFAGTKEQGKPAMIVLENKGKKDSPYSGEKKTGQTVFPRQSDREGIGSVSPSRRPVKSIPREMRSEEVSSPSVKAEQALPQGGGNSEFKLEALVWSKNPNDRFAVINGQIVRAGGSIKGASVTEIERNHVALRSGNKTWELRIQAAQ